MPPIRHILRFGAAPHYVEAPDLSTPAPRDAFLEIARGLSGEAHVLEVGTKQSVEGTATHWHSLFPQVKRKNYVMADVQPGTDVDIVTDLHALPADWADRFDACVARAVFEHLERPWIAAKEVARVLRRGGACYIATHQTFPLHAYPFDFFRFSREALMLLFSDAGLRIVEAGYEHRVDLAPPQAVVPRHLHREWNATWPSYLCVHLCAVKV